MHFQEDTIHASSDRRTRQHRDELGLTAADGRTPLVDLRRGQLDGMRRVENYGRELTHDRERAHVDDQIVVSEAGAALREKDLRVAGFAALLYRMPHVPRRNKLSFLDIDGAAAERGRDHEVGLAAEKGGNLQHVGDFRDLGHVRHFVDIRKHGELNFVFDLLENAQTLFHAGSAKAANRSAVGFVVADFEDKRKLERPRHALDDLGHANGVLFALDHAWTGNEEDIARADADIADLEIQFQVFSFRFRV